MKYSGNVNTGNIFNTVTAEEKFVTSKHHWTNENGLSTRKMNDSNSRLGHSSIAALLNE